MASFPNLSGKFEKYPTPLMIVERCSAHIILKALLDYSEPYCINIYYNILIVPSQCTDGIHGEKHCANKHNAGWEMTCELLCLKCRRKINSEFKIWETDTHIHILKRTTGFLDSVEVFIVIKYFSIYKQNTYLSCLLIFLPEILSAVSVPKERIITVDCL